MRRWTLAALAALSALGLAAPAPAAQVTVGSGSSLDLGTGSLDLGCADLTVAGTLSAGTAGFTQARDVTIDPTGLVNGNSATLAVAGDWDNAGTFNAGTSNVQGSSSTDFVDVQDNDATAGNPVSLGPGSVKGARLRGRG